jgi:hypothetical protein
MSFTWLWGKLILLIKPKKKNIKLITKKTKKRSVIYQMELTSPINCLYENRGASSYQAKEWKPLEKNFSIELPRDTLVLAEKCIEYTGTVSFNLFNLIKIQFLFNNTHTKRMKVNRSSMPFI